MSGSLTARDLSRIRRLAREMAGISLEDRHDEFLDRRLSRWASDDNFRTVLEQAESGEEAARQSIIRLLTTSYTHFFRNPAQFRMAADCAEEAVCRRREARLWCSAVATGEEAYSLAISLIEKFGVPDPPVRILATDINTAVLASARRGEFAARTLTYLTPAQRERFLDRTIDGRYSVSSAPRGLVRFSEMNLTVLPWSELGVFDVIFCRNVLMYMTPEHRYSVLEQMTEVLSPDGLLFLDPAEYLGPAQHMFEAGEEGSWRLSSRSRWSGLR